MDKSEDEQGFRVRVEFSREGQTYTFDVPANTTSFVIPSDIPKPSPEWDECDARAVFGVTISAYNAAGESGALSAGGVTGDCGTPIPRTPTPTAR